MLNICKLKEFEKFIIFSMTNRCAILPMLNPNTYTYTILSTVVYIHVKNKKKQKNKLTYEFDSCVYAR